MQIAARLGISTQTLEDAAKRFEDVLLALAGGKARGIDELSSAVYRAARLGDMQAATFMLRTRAGYATRAERSEAPKGEAEDFTGVTLDHINEIAERQRLIG